MRYGKILFASLSLSTGCRATKTSFLFFCCMRTLQLAPLSTFSHCGWLYFQLLCKNWISRLAPSLDFPSFPRPRRQLTPKELNICVSTELRKKFLLQLFEYK